MYRTSFALITYTNDQEDEKVLKMATILVVDDDDDILTFVTNLMTNRGHTVITATDGESALSKSKEELVDIVILDINIPKKNGFEVCRELKSHVATKKIPIIMMTAAYVSVEDAEKGSTLGADEYVSKPFFSEVMIHNVERLLTSAK